ncbi:diguanylate cyclase domain-containing protein [Geomesophilobacter sediminis]|uniref:diguanylate cyclase n=1 Tax=Geomesophilobacter sediminis TaxID=2798584 RepID=A0A8J7S7T7_9BACT|nr:diguanylate cyclase [Geomesophilobacter sediminis]MBJ6727211.1 diguanylate cyclase [Geomesophilobacter sediminis]
MSSELEQLQAGLEVVIVEDSPTQAFFLHSLLERNRFQVQVASSGYQAIELVTERPPALVISDVLMPEMDGYELCARIKADPRSHKVPVMLLTSLSEPLDLIRGLKCGADCFLTKPYHEDHLIARIHNLFANQSIHPGEIPEVDLNVFLADEKHRITADPMRLLTFLFSSYETALHNNRELIKVRDELRRLSTHDPLTGLYNRMFFDEELLRLGMGREFPVSIISADVDGLKTVNDTLGHDAGDQLIRIAAEILTDSFRAEDVVARIGGDEFVILLPNADSAVAHEVLKRLAERVSEANQRDLPYCVSLSFGAATAHCKTELSPALRESDRLMYQNKFEHKQRERENPTDYPAKGLS